MDYHYVLLDITPVTLSVLALGITVGGLASRLMLYVPFSAISAVSMLLFFVASNAVAWYVAIFFAGAAVGNFIAWVNAQMQRTIKLLIAHMTELQRRLEEEER
jgi:hypothetical protein